MVKVDTDWKKNVWSGLGFIRYEKAIIQPHITITFVAILDIN